jgi:DNA-binding GntR family transcriptional regulator
VQFDRVHQPSLVERVAGDLRAAIIGGMMRPGEKISDARIAADMGVSRAPVREAIRRLAAQGLVREEPRRGAFVTSLSRRQVSEVYDCRRALEGLAVQRVAAEDDGSVADELEEIIDEMYRVARRGDRDELASIDQHFHTRLCEHAGNTWLDRLYALIADQMRLILTVNNVAHPLDDVNEMAEIHRPIVRAIAAREPAAALAAVLEHLDTAERLFLDEASGVIDRAR